jgi:peptide/nickel transport system permease protein
MAAYAVRRILVAIPMVCGLLVLTFFYVHILPGDPVGAMLGPNQNPQLVHELRHEFGLDRPLLAQFGAWVSGLVHGNLGISFRSQFPVSDLVFGRVPAAAELALGGLVVMLAVGIPAGLAAGMRRGSLIDRSINTVALFGLAVPGFYIGVLLVLIFSLKLNLLPSQGYVPFSQDPIGNLRTLVLPATTLGLSAAPFLARLTRSAVIEVMESKFIPFAHSKGLAPIRISTRYVLRNTWPHLVAVIALSVGFLLGGSIVVEQIFSWPGTGQLVFAAVQERDYTMIQAVILLYGMTFVCVNLIGELIQGLLDPRIRLN